MTSQYYLGIMSGTSADGVDLALVDFTQSPAKLIADGYYPYEKALAERIIRLYQTQTNELELMASLDIELGRFFAQCVERFIEQHGIDKSRIAAIGNHGQTLRHRPNQAYPFTLQIGSCTELAVATGLRVIGQFRQKDVALGGQGAPLIPCFHQYLVQDNCHDCAFLNIGGIANISFISAKSAPAVVGFDTGPGNGLLDAWFVKHHPNAIESFDRNGAWSAQGNVLPELLQQCLADDYFSAQAPKSTGREYFNLNWLMAKLSPAMSAVDVQATLVELTAQSIVQSIEQANFIGDIYLLGGGRKNLSLIQRLTALLPNCQLLNSNFNGIDSDNMEASCFAWLAFAYDKKIYSNNPSVTGAYQATTLGCEFLP